MKEKSIMRNAISSILLAATLLTGLAGIPAASAAIVVNSLEDSAAPPPGTVTLRSALAQAADGEPILFDPGLDGATIPLSIVGEEHTTLKGEVMGMRDEPSGPVSYLVGYFDRDYGRSALYARKNVVLDASALPGGVTVAWTGGDANPARVLAVYGDLTMKNISVKGGRSVAVALPNPDPEDENAQLSTRARGGALAVWGVARLEKCRLFDNSCYRALNIPARSRDAGVFGGGIYADIVDISDSQICGNSVLASGTSGGGVFAVGGAEAPGTVSTVVRTAVTGNKIAGIFTYGAGVYSDGGGIGNAKVLRLVNCTIADNLIDIFGPSFLYGIGYWRGGGVYISNGYLEIFGCTIVNNEVYGVPRTSELDKPNLAGGVAATIGNAHAVETMKIGQSIIAGNRVHERGGATYLQDIFPGSLQHFISYGHNRIGVIEFSHILVPVGQPTWYSLCRRHYPKPGDKDGVNVADIVDLDGGITYSADILSAGVSASRPAVLHYAPKGSAIDQVNAVSYALNLTYAEYRVIGLNDNFLEIILGRLEKKYALANFATAFTADFEAFLAGIDLDPGTPGNQPYTSPGGKPILSLKDTAWFGPLETWPSQLPNYPYIEFWHRLDRALQAADIPGMGPELLGDDAWQALFDDGLLAENRLIDFSIWTVQYFMHPLTTDQNGTARTALGIGDIGALEFRPSPVPRLHLDAVTSSGTGTNLAIRWNSDYNKFYTLWGTSDLTSGSWTPVASGIKATVPYNVHTVASPDPRQFYKVEID